MDFPVARYLASGVDGSEPIAAPEAVGAVSVSRDEHFKPSLARFKNARSISIDLALKTLPAWFRKFRRLRELSITSDDLKTLPPWLPELEDLRHLSLDQCSELAKIPSHVWNIPRLESLWLFHTTFDELDGIERAPALRQLIVYSRELAPHLPAIAERLRSAKGVTRVVLDDRTIRITRTSTARIPSSAKKAAAILPSLPRRHDCRGIDLRGQTFEDLDIELDLRNANLDKTTWRRCRFQHTDLSGASARAALFDHCQFEGNSTLAKLKAAGAVFRSCHLGASLEGSALEGATIEATPDSFLMLSGCKLRNARVEAVYTTPQSGSYTDLSRADLRGAQVSIRLTSEAAERLAKSRTKLRWKKASSKGAKVDKQTTIEHAALRQEKVEKPSGPAATSIGTLCGANASCWFVVADSAVARGWRGSKLDDDYEELPGTDFSRALQLDNGTIKVGSGKGVLASVGDCGCSKLWVDGKTWCLLYANEGEDIDRNSKQGMQLIGMRVAQLPAKRITKVGRFDVRSGCMTLLLPYTPNPFTDEQIAEAKKSGKVRGIPNDHDALLVPVPNGSYTVNYEDLSHEDDVGSFYRRIRIAPVA